MRNLGEVIDKMLAIIPAHESGFIRQLNGIKETSFYTPPECMVDLWEYGSRVMQNYFGDEKYLRDTWEDAVIHIWMGS